MNDDDEDTERRRRPDSNWDDDKRANVGAQHRFATDSAVRRRKAARSHPNGVAVVDPVIRDLSDTGEVEAIKTHEITEPVDLIDRDLSQAELEIVRRSRRDSTDVSTVADLAKLTKRLLDREADDRSSRKEQADQLMQLLNRPPHESVAKLQASLAEQGLAIAALTTWWKPIRAVLIFLAIAALGAVGFFVDKIMSSVEQKGEVQIRLDHIEHAISDMRQDIRDERPHYVPPAPDHPIWLQPPTKDVKP